MQIQFHLSSAFLQSLLDERTRRQLVRCYEPFQALNLELLVDRPRLVASTIGAA